jgi:hypothetical protein
MMLMLLLLIAIITTTERRWDKNNFDGNDDLAWLQSAAAVLEEMRTDLLAFGIQVGARGIAVDVACQY